MICSHPDITLAEASRAAAAGGMMLLSDRRAGAVIMRHADVAALRGISVPQPGAARHSLGISRASQANGLGGSQTQAGITPGDRQTYQRRAEKVERQTNPALRPSHTIAVQRKKQAGQNRANCMKSLVATGGFEPPTSAL